MHRKNYLPLEVSVLEFKHPTNIRKHCNYLNACSNDGYVDSL